VVGLLEAMLIPYPRHCSRSHRRRTSHGGRGESAREAREWSKRNKSIPHEQVLAELGINEEEIELQRMSFQP